MSCDSNIVKTDFGCTNNFMIVGGVIISYIGNEKEITIPNGVIKIGKCAFKNNLIVQKIIFSNTIYEIGESAFENCKNLKEICNYYNVRIFEKDCFRNSGLNEVKICVCVEKLEKNCFSDMLNLKKVIYMPEKNLKLNHTFFNCKNLEIVETDRLYFFPAFKPSLLLKNNSSNNRPTFSDAFIETPFIKNVKQKYLKLYKQRICPECGGHISVRIFHAKCSKCKIDYRY